jgi:hypothetical protein
MPADIHHQYLVQQAHEPGAQWGDEGPLTATCEEEKRVKEGL